MGASRVDVDDRIVAGPPLPGGAKPPPPGGRRGLRGVERPRTAPPPHPNPSDVHPPPTVRPAAVRGPERKHVDRIARGDEGFRLSPYAGVALIVALDDEADRGNWMTHGGQEAMGRCTTRTPEPRASSRTKRTRRRARNQSTAWDAV